MTATETGVRKDGVSAWLKATIEAATAHGVQTPKVKIFREATTSTGRLVAPGEIIQRPSDFNLAG